MRCLTRFSVLSLLALWTPALSSQAQTAAGAAAEFGEVIDVELVNVDVWVVDGDGHPVPGLTAADFRVSHDGTEVEVTHFVEASRSRSPGVAAETGSPPSDLPDLPPADEASVVVYLDQMRTHPIHVAAMVEDLEGLLEAQQLRPEQILVLRQDTALHVEAPFGSSRRQLMKAFDQLRRLTAEGAELDSHSAQALRQLQDLWRINEQRQAAAASAASAIPDLPAQAGGGSVLDRFRGGGGREGFGGDLCADFVTQADSLVLDWARYEAARSRVTLETLRRVGGFLAGLPGVKSLIYVSDGLDLRPGGPLASYVYGLCPGRSRATADLDAESMDREFLELTRDLNARRVTVYAVQAGGLTSSRSEDASQSGFAGSPVSARARSAYETGKKSGERQGLQLLAEETGGRLLVRRNDLARAMLDLVGDLRPQYSLAYPLPRIESRRKATRTGGQRIEVEVAGKGRSVRYRRGWAEVQPDRLLADRLDGALYLGLVENPLGLRLGAADPTVGPDGRTTLPLRVMVPVANLVPLVPASEPAVAAAARVMVRVVARQLETQELVATETSFRINLPAAPTDELSVLPVDLVLGPGSFTIAVGLRDEGSVRTSVVTTDLDLGPG